MEKLLKSFKEFVKNTYGDNYINSKGTVELERLLIGNQLDESVLQEFFPILDKSVISRLQILSEDFIKEHKLELYWDHVIKVNILSENLIREIVENPLIKFSFGKLLMRQVVPLDLIKKNIPLCRTAITYQKLDEEAFEMLLTPVERKDRIKKALLEKYQRHLISDSREAEEITGYYMGFGPDKKILSPRFNISGEKLNETMLKSRKFFEVSLINDRVDSTYNLFVFPDTIRKFKSEILCWKRKKL